MASKRAADPTDPAAVLPAHVEQTVRAIADLHAAHHQQTTPSERTLQRIVWIVARPRFLLVLTVVLGAWMAMNGLLMASGHAVPDPPPFFWMDTAVAVSALYVMVIILTTQRRDDQLSQLREQLTLELAILSEQKSAKTIELLEELRRDTPTVRDRPDLEAEAMARPADPQSVLEAIQDTQAEAGLPEAEVRRRRNAGAAD